MKIILGLAGEIASGKGTTAQYIIDKYNGSSHRFSTMLRDVARRMYLEENRENLQKLSTIFRQNFHDNILSIVISKDMANDSHEIIVLDGVRRLADIANLKKLENFRLAFIETSLKKRFERIRKRKENTDDEKKAFEEFKRDHEKEAEFQIRKLKDQTDYIIDNNSSLEDLYKQIDKMI